MFGILTSRNIKDNFAPIICLAAPIICFIVDKNADKFIKGFAFGPEMLLWNGLLTFVGLYLISKPTTQVSALDTELE
ncbi:MAG: hypothetical protein IPF58_16420 [Saprospirales bacterium]|nr:hypothetical protein [Saprospirales bacterium]